MFFFQGLLSVNILEKTKNYGEAFLMVLYRSPVIEFHLIH